MRFLVLVVSLVAFLKPLDPVPELPKWATKSCVTTINRIVAHEVGGMDSEAWTFVAEQVVYDARTMGCANLTQWRWAIGNAPVRASEGVKSAVMDVLLAYPNLSHPKCKFVGNLGDIRVWRGAGYRVSVDYRHGVGNLVLVGVNCGSN